jgi:hypothetical protein
MPKKKTQKKQKDGSNSFSATAKYNKIHKQHIERAKNTAECKYVLRN